MKKPRAFTLIELLVVIAIIGLLSTVVLSSLDASRAKARDASRLSAIHQVQNALQLYFADNGGAYPLAASPVPIETLAASLAPKYISAVTVDETNVAGSMYYRPSNKPDSYLIYVAYEHQTQASPVAYGCRTGTGPVIDSGLYSTAPRC
jgi:prepilin-type N-terminal cleavage/methylation domain-containing protein